MKTLFRILTFIFFLSIFILPLPFAIIMVYWFDFEGESVMVLIVLLKSVLMLLCILSESFRDFAVEHTKLPYNMLKQMDENIKQRKIRQFQDRSYVWIKRQER